MTKPADPVLVAIRVEMVRRGLRQKDIADALGCTQATVSSRMNGHTDWSIAELRTIAGVLDVDVVDLVGAA